MSDIIGTNIILRSLCYEDVEMIRRWRNQDSIRHWFIHTEIISEDQQKKWWEKYNHDPTDLMFVILRREDALPIGALALYNLVQGEEAEFGRLMIGEPCARGKGYAVEATRLLSDFGFFELGLKKITLAVLQDNAVAIDVYCKCNFMVIGRKGEIMIMSRSKENQSIGGRN